jgi:hypothetical protein
MEHHPIHASDVRRPDKGPQKAAAVVSSSQLQNSRRVAAHNHFALHAR